MAGRGILYGLTSLVLFCAQPARAQCPDWSSGFGTVGLDDNVYALTVFDDGSGPALYAGGNFQSADDQLVRHIARWNGTSWSGVGLGMDAWYDRVGVLATFDDGTGPALYAGGSFASIGGQSFNNIAKWDGVAWSPLPPGVTGTVLAMAVFDDGSGPALYLGGTFLSAGGVPANRIAKFDGTSWSALGSGANNEVRGLAVFDDGSGSALYASGIFTSAGGVPANRIARWNGTTWSAVGSGMNGPVGNLVVHDDGTGPALYAGGLYTSAGGSSAASLARWNGSSWLGMNPGNASSGLMSIASCDDGSGSKLYAGGFSEIRRWDGSSWQIVGPARASCMRTFDEGSGAHLFVGGDSNRVGSTVASHIVRWNGGSTWSAVSNGQGDGMGDNIILDLAVVDIGGGPKLYAGGIFKVASNALVNYVASFDGTIWSALGSGLSENAYAITGFDDGSGMAVYVGGAFNTAGGAPIPYIARWNGSSWSPVGSGTGGTIRALKVFDSGTGPALYAGGDLSIAGGMPCNRIAKWDGSAWSTLGSGVQGTTQAPVVTALTTFDDGTGPALYVAGIFETAGGVTASSIARWSGTTWSAISGAVTGTNGAINTLATFDDGTGMALYVGGDFTAIGGMSASGLAKWNGASWTGITGLGGQVIDMAFFDDGSGPALYVTGNFASAGGNPTRHIARWSGTSWSGLGSGPGLTQPGSGGSIDFGRAAAVYDDGLGSGPALFIGGSFSLADGVPAKNIARWQGCGHPGVALCPGDGSVTSCPCGNDGAAGRGCQNSALTGGALLESDGWNSLAHDSLKLTSSGELPSSLSIALQGNVQIAPVPFGDGLRCTGGALSRLYVHNASGGSVTVPQLGDLSISARSAALGHPLSAGTFRLYQMYYRDPSLSFCPSPAGNTWNVSNALKISWLP